MGACHIQSLLLLSLLGFVPCSDSLSCLDGTLVKFGQNFSREEIDWFVKVNVSTDTPHSMCQETLILIDVGERSVLLGSKGFSEDASKIQKTQVFSSGPGIVAVSYIHFCNTNDCNRTNNTKVLLDSLSLADSSEQGTTQCPVCLQLKGSCTFTTNLAFCPVNTNCYTGSLGIHGGDLSTFFNIFGCLDSSRTLLWNNQTSIGVIIIKEVLETVSTPSLSHVLVQSTLLAWTLGFSALLSPLCAGICPLC